MFAAAQTHQHGPPENKGIDLAKLPAPQRIEGIGQAHIPITTKSPQAQEWFDQGLALQHCFWHYEAERSFEESVRLDPDCAMCHWGLSQAATERRSRSRYSGAGAGEGARPRRPIANSAMFAPTSSSKTRKARRLPRHSSKKWRRWKIVILTICRPSCFWPGS